MGPASALSALTLLLATSHSWAQNPFVPVTNTCSLKTCQEPSKFGYMTGEAYRYRYQANTASTVLGVSSRSTTLTLECDLILHVISPCEHAITMEDVRLHTVAVDEDSLTDKDVESDSFTSPLEGFQLRFGFQDGIVDSVCPETGDPTWSVNIKKGIVSALQNSMDRLDVDYDEVERDITGDCPTSYTVEGVQSTGLIINKIRNLNACVGRFAHTSHIQGVGYNIKSPVQNIPLVSSSSECRQTVQTRRLTSVQCEESHQLKPFSHNASGAVTVTAQNLTLIDVSDAAAAQDVMQKRESLLYNHMPAKSASLSREQSLGDAEALVLDLCKDDSEVRVDSTTQFSQLIDDLRGMSPTEIRSLYRLSPSICRHGRQLIEDALPVVSTAASLELMRDLILDEEVTPAVANTWLMALNFIPSVDQEMLRTAGGLLQVRQQEVVTRARLAVGAVLNQYCRQHERCDRDSVALEIVDEMARPLGGGCRAETPAAEKEILLTLRAIGNAGLSPPGVVYALNECFMDRDNPPRIKVAAIEAFRRFTCMLRRDEMRAVFRDLAEDSEVRIAAYLALMRCPSHEEIGLVRTTLEQEQVNQVGSFIWTHLKNLQETASPYQLEVQGLLADLHLQKKFIIDTRKFSRNFEISGFNSEFHVGASLDSNLIFSSRSYVPRSLNSNLTLQLFGESVNLVEVGARVEGLERLIESVFAPRDMQADGDQPPPPGARDAKKEQLEKIKAEFDAAGRFGNPMAFFHLKVFGHEVDHVDLRSSDMERISAWLAQNSPAHLLGWRSNAESLDISRSIKFLEGTYIVPTGLGLPLNLTASAVAAVNLQMSGHAQLARLLVNQEMDLAFRLRPSGAVTFDGTMTVDGMAVQLGMGMKATVHSSSLVDGSIKMQGFRLVDAQINMPKERMDLYNFESSLRFIHQDKQKVITSDISMEGDRHEQVSFNYCTGGERIKGWRTCAHLMYVNASANTLAPHFPLTGPAKYGLFIEKTDKTMEGYKLQWKVSESKFEHHLSLLFDTPKSTINRKVELKMKRSKKHGRIGFILTYPGERVNGKGEAAWEPDKKKLVLEVSRQGIEVLALTAQLVKVTSRFDTVYRPTFILKIAQNPHTSLEGFVKLSDTGSEKNRIIDLSMKSPFINLRLDTNATENSELYRSKIALHHSVQNFPERQLLLLLEAQDTGDGDGGRVGHWMATFDLDVSERVRLAWAARWDHRDSQAGSMHKIQTAAKPEDFDKMSTFAAGYAFDFTATKDSSKMRGSVELMYPAAGVDLKLAAEHENIYRGLTNRITLRYAPGRELRSVLNLTGLPLWRSGRLDGGWRLDVPGYPRPIELSGSVRIAPRQEPDGPQTYRFRLQGGWLRGGSALAVGQYQLQRHLGMELTNHSVNLNLTVDRQPLLATDFRLALSPGQVVVELQVDHEGSEYGVAVQYDVLGSVSELQRAVHVSLTYPGAGYSVTGTLRLADSFRTTLDLSLDGRRDIQIILGGALTNSLLEALVDVKWDVNRDPTQRLLLDLRAQQPTEAQRNLTVVVVYPVNTIQLSMDRTMTGSWQRLQYDNHLMLTFGQSDTVEATISASTELDKPTKRVTVDVAASSPFPNWRSNSLRLRHVRSPSDLDSRLEVAAGGEQLTLSVSGENRLPRRLHLLTKLTTSLERWPHLQASLTHLAERDSITSSLAVETPTNTLTADLGLYQLSTDTQRRYRAELNASTPFQGLHDVSYSLDGKFGAGEILVSGASRVENIGHDLLVSGRGWGRDERLEGSVIVDQVHPHQNKLTAVLLVDPTEKGRAFKSSLLWPGNRISLEGDMHFASAQDFGIGLQFLSPLEAIKDAGLMVKHKLVRDEQQELGWKMQTEARVAWLLHNPLALTVDAQLSSLSSFELSSELSLPVEGWSRASVAVWSRPQPESQSLSAGIRTALDQYQLALTADGSLGVLPADKRYGTVTVTLPSGPLQQLSVAASVLPSRRRRYELFLSPSWHLRDGTVQEIRLTSTVDLGEPGQGTLQSTVRLLTPWHELLFLELQHKPSPPEGFTTRLVGSLGRNSVQLRGRLMKLEEQNGYKFLLNTTSNIPSVPAFDSATTLIMHPEYLLTISAWIPQEVRLTVGADLSSPVRQELQAELITPLQDLDLVSASLTVAGDDRERAVMAVVTLPGPGREIRVSGTVRPMDVRLSITTPFESLASGSLRLSAGVGSGRLDPVFRLTWDSYKIEIGGTAVTEGRGLPSQVTGTLTVHLPVVPRVSGNFQLNSRSGERSVYDLTATFNIDQNSQQYGRTATSYQLEGEIFVGPQKYGFTMQTTSSDPAARLSGEFIVSLDEVPGLKALRVKLNTPHDPLRNVSANIEYRMGEKGRRLTIKLHHPKLTFEAAVRLLLRSWEEFHVSAEGKLSMGQLDLERAIRLYRRPTAGPGPGTEIGLGWDLASAQALAGWGRYHALLEYRPSRAGLDVSLLAGRDVWRDRTAPTDLRAGLDLDWQPEARMGRAVLTVHLADSQYTLDSDYSARGPYTGSVRLVRRQLGSEWEVTGRASLTPGSDRWLGTLNLTLPVEGYKALDTGGEFTRPSAGEYGLSVTVTVDPKSSFYQRTRHQLQLNSDITALPSVSGDFSYLHQDLDDDEELAKATGQLTTTYTSQEMGLDLQGTLNSGSYTLMALQSTKLHGKNGQLEITTTFPLLEDFLAKYDFERGDGGAVQTTFSSVYNQKTLIDGAYSLTRDGGGSQRHTLDLKNPLHPFDAELTYAATDTQRRVDGRLTSQLDTNSTVSGWAQVTRSASGRQLEASLQLPWRSLAVNHSVERSADTYRRSARLTLSPEAFVGYQLTLTSGTDMPGEEGGSGRLQLDLPPRSLAGSVLAGLTRRTDGSFSSGRSQLRFLWDAEGQPERQVGGIFKVSNLSTRDNLHYNLSITADIAGKPATLETSVQRSGAQPLQLDAAFLYSDDPDSRLALSYGVVDQSRGSKRVLKSTLFVTHPVSKLSVTGKGQLEMARDVLKLSGSYTYLDIEDRTLKSGVNVVFDKKLGEFKGEVTLPSMLYELKSTAGFAEYRINGAAIPTEFGSAQTLLVTVDRSRPLAQLEILYDPEQAKRLYISGGLVNNRTARLEAYRQAGRYRVDDVVLFLRLNHSHLLTSQARWRTELGRELVTWAKMAAVGAKDALLDATSSEWEVKSGAIESSLEQMFGPELDMIVEDFTSVRTGTVRGDFEDLHYSLKESYDNNEFYMKTIFSYIYGEDSSLVNSLLNQLDSLTEKLREDMGVISEAVYDKLNWMIEYLRSMVSSREGDRTMADTLREVLAEVAEAYNQWAKHLYVRASLRLRQVYSQVTGYVRHRLMELAELYRPQLLMLHHHIETNIIQVVRDTVEWFYGEFTQSELYAVFKWLEQTVDQVYRDISERDAVTNVFDYARKIFRWLYTKFGLVDVFGETGMWLKDKWDNPPPALAQLKELVTLINEKAYWTVDYLGLVDVAQRVLSKIYRDGDKFWTQTAIQSAQRYFEGKSIMVMRPESGYISFIQILPMPWYGLNQSPVWEELPELQKIKQLQSWTESSDWNIYDIVFEYWPGFSPSEWLPPFKGHAVLSGSSTFVTFDGKMYTFRADCTYLLAADLLDNRFSMEATFRRQGPVTKTVTLSAGGHTVQLGGRTGYTITADGQRAEAPLQAGPLSVTRSGDVLTVRLQQLLTLRCNQRSDVCSVEISRWMFGRTGGLLGTLDYEASTDLQTPSHLQTSEPLFANSWALDSCARPADISLPDSPQPDTISLRTPSRPDGFCSGLLAAASSEYRPCYRLLDPAPFLAACEQQQQQQRCVAVRAYVEACQQLGWPLKMPNKCVQCNIRGTPVFEGKTVRVENEAPVTEVVFIVEAKRCNANLTTNRSMGQLVKALNLALRRDGFVNTKFAVVAFGGDGVLDEPQAMTVGGQIFSSARRVMSAFRKIQPGSGNRDVFGALRRAAMLPFSPGVSRTFILLPCSACEANAMSVDYTTLANAFAEQQITLHIVMDGDLSVSKKKRKLLGIDRSKAWTLKDAKTFRGDPDLLKLVTSPKAALRLCEPLSTKQTQGSIFSSSKLSPHPKTGVVKARPLKKLVTVFGQRVAQTARPEACQLCECVADVEGTARSVCVPCSTGFLRADPEDESFFEDYST